MISFGDVGFKELVWVQRSSTEDELVSEGRLVAALHWTSAWGSLATGESADGTWTFKRAGFLHPAITIREPGSDRDLYIASVAWDGKLEIDIPRVGSFRWTPNFWRRKWALYDSLDAEVMRIDLSGYSRPKGKVSIVQPSMRPHALSLLCMLGWHLIMNVVADQAAAAASAAGS